MEKEPKKSAMKEDIGREGLLCSSRQMVRKAEEKLEREQLEANRVKKNRDVV